MILLLHACIWWLCCAPHNALHINTFTLIVVYIWLIITHHLDQFQWSHGFLYLLFSVYIEIIRPAAMVLGWPRMPYFFWRASPLTAYSAFYIPCDEISAISAHFCCWRWKMAENYSSVSLSNLWDVMSWRRDWPPLQNRTILVFQLQLFWKHSLPTNCTIRCVPAI